MTETSIRYAIYYAPAPDSPLWEYGCRVIGYDAAFGGPVAPFAELVEPAMRWSEHAAEPARYGFHATLKAPFHLAPGQTEVALETAVASLAGGCPAVPLGELQVRAMTKFVALVPVQPSAHLNLLEQAMVRELDKFRAPLTPQDRARRRPAKLSPRQLASLERWGYPFVCEDFRFHMTLAGPLEPDRLTYAVEILSQLYKHFAEPVRVDDVCIFKQLSPDAPFTIMARHPLSG